MALESTQPLTEMSTTNLPGGKGWPAHKAVSLTWSVSRLSRKCVNLDVSPPFRPSRPVTGIALLFFLRTHEDVSPAPTPWTPFMWQPDRRGWTSHFSAFFSRPNGPSALNCATGNARFRVVISAISVERLSCHSALYNVQNNDFSFDSLELSCSVFGDLFSTKNGNTSDDPSRICWLLWQLSFGWRPWYGVTAIETTEPLASVLSANLILTRKIKSHNSIRFWNFMKLCVQSQ
jgi:hypothetical protein